MANIGARLEIDPGIVARLDSNKSGLWRAAHDDGAANRINPDAVADAATYGAPLGVLMAGFPGLRKAYRNRGKTKEDFAAEKEAAQINRTCGVLDQMLLEYLQAARMGDIDAEALGELIGTLEEMEGYHRAGKLSVPGEEELDQICKSVSAFTAAMLKDGSGKPAPADGADAFGQLRCRLTCQREWLDKR